MAAFLKIYEQRNLISDKFFKMLEDTREQREIEYRAALTIQSAFHRFIFKKYYAELNKRATIIQKTFRMYRAKVLVKCIRVEQEQAFHMKYFNKEALKIQRAFRKFIADGKVTIKKADLDESPDGNEVKNPKIKIRKVIKKRRKKISKDFLIF